MDDTRPARSFTLTVAASARLDDGIKPGEGTPYDGKIKINSCFDKTGRKDDTPSAGGEPFSDLTEDPMPVVRC